MIALLILLLLTSCVWTESSYEPIQMDTTIVKKRTITTTQIQTDQQLDTIKVPIIFNPSIESWEEKNN
jgi:hypothetical protein